MWRRELRLTSLGAAFGLPASNCVMSSLISARSSLFADSPRSVPNKESNSAACNVTIKSLLRCSSLRYSIDITLLCPS